MPHDSLQQTSPAWGCGWDGENTVLKTFEKRLFHITDRYLPDKGLVHIARKTGPYNLPLQEHKYHNWSYSSIPSP